MTRGLRVQWGVASAPRRWSVLSQMAMLSWLACSGCVRFTASTTEAGPASVDAQADGRPDGAQGDQTKFQEGGFDQGDARRPELGSPDASPDGATDLPVLPDETTGPDQTVGLDVTTVPDVTVPDVTVPPDVTAPDLSISDLGTIANACASGSSPVQVYATNMVTCRSTPGVDQCHAEARCSASAGWSICNAAQFLARGGKTTNTTLAAWLAACIRSGPTATAPTNATCPCVAGNESATQVGWRCGSGSASDTKNDANIGVSTFFDCRRVGVNNLNHEGAWHPLGSIVLLEGTVCCR